MSRRIFDCVKATLRVGIGEIQLKAPTQRRGEPEAPELVEKRLTVNGCGGTVSFL